MKTLLVLLAVCSLLIGCSIDRTKQELVEKEKVLLKEFQQLGSESRVRIAVEEEPGEPLWLCITLTDKKSKRVLKNRKIHFFQTDTKGEYQPRVATDESTARISGSAITDSNGRVFLETILPGDYGSSADNRHIHTTIFGAKPEGYDLGFKQYSTYMGTRFSEGSDQHFIVDLRSDGAKTLVGFQTIEAKLP